MSDGPTVQRSFRLAPQTADLLDRAAARSHLSRNALADRLLGEALRLERHPHIRYRQGFAGRRQACLDGSRLYVHEVVDAARAGGGIADAAEYFGLDLVLVEAAVAFAADFPDEIADDERVHQVDADEERARWERAQRAVG